MADPVNAAGNAPGTAYWQAFDQEVVQVGAAVFGEVLTSLIPQTLKVGQQVLSNIKDSTNS